jgi:Tat protein translocase TatB subunit
MPGLGFPSEIILIFIVALIVFGPKRLPDIAKSLGRAMNEFKRSMNEFKRQIETEIGTENIKEDLLRQQREIQQKLASLNPAAQGPVPDKIDKIETTEFADYGQAAANKASAANAKPREGKPGESAGQTPEGKEGASDGEAQENKSGASSGQEDKAGAAPAQSDSPETTTKTPESIVPAPHSAPEEPKKKDA